MDIETKRLLLVPVQLHHVGDIFQHFNDKIITYLLPNVPDHISITEKVVENFINQRENKTDYVFAITLLTTGEFIGLVGLHNLVNPVPTLGIWTKFESHGNHFGREAIGGMIDYASKLEHKKLLYPVDRRNIASKKIPLFYGGKLIVELKEVTTFDGRILEEEIYEITV